jgi:hypothetical protein
LAFVGPGFDAYDTDGWAWLIGLPNGGGNRIAAKTFRHWLDHHGFLASANCSWSRTATMGIHIQERDGFAGLLNAIFDRARSEHFEDWLATCKELLQLGFRVVNREEAGPEELRELIGKSHAWQLSIPAFSISPLNFLSPLISR